jgi:surfactin synthase thioesterase subunit
LVLVVPHAGAGASVAKGLRPHAPAQWLIAGVQFAGRESRFTEPPGQDLSALVKDVVTAARELRAEHHRPVTLVGQCSGALLAYLAARELTDTPDAVDALVAVSRRPPDYAGTLPDPDLDDETYFARVLEIGGVPAKVAAMPDLVELLIPALRADFTALGRWQPDGLPLPALDVPVLAVHATGDPDCAAPLMAPWARFGTGLVQRELEGDHFLIGSRSAAVAAMLAHELPRLTSVSQEAPHVVHD